MFKNAQIGDRVYDPRYKDGTITFINPNNIYSIRVEFDFKLIQKYYTFDGRSSLDYITPVLFWNELEIPPEAYIKPLPKLEKDTKVLVWNDSSEIKEKRYFSHFNKGKIYCYEQGCTSWSGTTAHDWDNWEFFKG